MQDTDNIIILSSKNRHKKLIRYFENNFKIKCFFFSSIRLLSEERLEQIKPLYIFVPHLNEIIPSYCFAKWETIIFHMTDLPYGRGGSPLQNLIKRGHKYTILSSIKCSSKLDAGDIFLKDKLSLHGTAEEIFFRSDNLIKKQMNQILSSNLNPYPQEGEVVIFKRRKPTESDVSYCKKSDLNDWYDHIRMLDAEDYPHAYLEYNGMKLEFTGASIKSDCLVADVKISPINKSND